MPSSYPFHRDSGAEFSSADGGADHDQLGMVRELWSLHRRWVAAILLAHMPRDAELEDLLQEVAIRLVRSAHELKDPAAVRPWLRTVAINLARTAGRRKKVRQTLQPEVIASRPRRDDEREEPVSVGSTREEGRIAMQVARSLPEEYREPLLLRAVRGMSYRQIGDVLGVPVTTVETRLVRARRMVREEIERLQGQKRTRSGGDRQGNPGRESEPRREAGTDGSEY